MKDFFISFTHHDKGWAEWIAHAIEDAGKTVIIQTWDFRPGSNFVLEMQEAARKADRTIMVLSPDYLKSGFASSEWAATFAQDPQGTERKLVPVVVRACKPEGLLAQIVHINLVGLDPDTARDTLLAGIKNQRAKPRTTPPFPGSKASTPTSNAVPAAEQPAAALKTYIPKMKAPATDIEKRRFLKDAFATVRDYFGRALPELIRAKRGLEFDFQAITNQEFVAELFLNGESISVCRLWIGNDMLSRGGIGYAEGQHHSSGSLNEVLTVVESEGTLGLTTMMGAFGYAHSSMTFDPKHMSPEQGAEYFWRRFIATLEQ